MQIWIWNDSPIPNLLKSLEKWDVCSFVRKVFWGVFENLLEFLRSVWGVLGVYGAKHSPSFSCFGGPSGWFWGFSQIHNHLFRKPLIFAIWASLANWDEEVSLKTVFKWCKYEFGMILGSQTYWNDWRNEMSAASSGRCSGGLRRSSGVSKKHLRCPRSIWCEALSFVLLFWWPFGLILGLFLKRQ